MLVIGSQDAVSGFALAGVRGQIVETRAELVEALDAAVSHQDLGIVLVSDDVAHLARERVDTLKAHSIVPLVIEIPGPAGPNPDRPSLSEMIRKTIGVRI